jgi:protein-S-isoprenylcysteine O-methyltransferase Ste14
MSNFHPDIELPSAWPSYITSIARTVILFGGGMLVSKGWFTAEQTTEIAGAVVAIATGIWALIQKRNANAKLKAAIIAPAGEPGVVK